MVYSNKKWFQMALNTREITATEDVWLAHFTDSTDFPFRYRIWQYTSCGTVDGITGNVDRNVGLFDYPTYLRENGYNHLQ